MSEAAAIDGTDALRHTCERSERVIASIAWRPFCVDSTRAWVSAVRRMTCSTSANVAMRMIVDMKSAVRSSGRVWPSSRRRRRITGTSPSVPPPVASQPDGRRAPGCCVVALITVLSSVA